MPVTVEELNRSSSIPMTEVLGEEGITSKSLAKKLKCELDYKEPYVDKAGKSRKRETYRAKKIQQEARKDAQRLMDLYPKDDQSKFEVTVVLKPEPIVKPDNTGL